MMIKWVISSSCLILFVIFLRHLFKGKISLHLQYALWALVAVRLLVPFNLGSSVLSIENLTNHLYSQPESQTTIVQNEPIEFNREEYTVKIYDGIEENRNVISNVNELKSPEVIQSSASKSIDITQILFGIWIVGIVILAVVFLSTNIYFEKRVRKLRDKIDVPYTKLPVYKSDAVQTPCLAGIFHPSIYVTKHVAENDDILRHAVFHEMTHYKQGDLYWAVIRCLCLTIHWYNPLVWWTAKLSKQDAELACDEATIKKLGEEERLAYGKTLIELTCEKRQDLFLTATTMASEKKSITERIRLIAKKPKLTIYALLIIPFAAIIAVICTFTNAADEQSEDPSSTSGWQIEDIHLDAVSNAEQIIDMADSRLRDGYVEAKLTYVDNTEVGWKYYADNPWSSEEERDELAQAALKELYTLTGYNVSECTYTTDGRSRFIFGKDKDYIRKSIAFYSRDFGFTLCGDSTPYIGFMNARRFHYSDVQQLDSPYNKEEYSGHAAIPMWFLEHSGVYQGEKIKGYDAVNLDDTVYTHIKLLFDGGYYMVVMDEEIESVSEVMGPYYAEESVGKNESYEEVFIQSETSGGIVQDEVYRNLITEMLETGAFPLPKGTQYNGNPYENYYAVMDIDGDRQDELLINFINADITAGMVYYIYDYDRVTGEVYLQHSGYPSFAVYENGYIKEDLSHNHGRSNLDDFWPYQLYKYNPETDLYEVVAVVDAWQERILEDMEPDPDFPKDKDLNGDGLVFYDMSDDYYDPTWIIDNEEYELWCEQYEQAAKKEIVWSLLGEPEIKESPLETDNGYRTTLSVEDVLVQNHEILQNYVFQWIS